jgi:hypothetical protein
VAVTGRENPLSISTLNLYEVTIPHEYHKFQSEAPTRMKVACVVIALISAVAALPNGAPLCEVGSSNTRNRHLFTGYSPKLTPVSNGYKVTIGGGDPLVALTPDNPDQTNLVQFGQELEIVVAVDPDSETPAPYLKGILVITSSGNPDDRDELDTKTPGSLRPIDPETKESIGCENFQVASLVHTENSEKQSLKGIFFWPTEGQKLFLDVNVVTNCNSTAGSQYSFSQYVLLTTNVDTSCGLLGLSLFCPGSGCGLFGRLLGLCGN